MAACDRFIRSGLRSLWIYVRCCSGEPFLLVVREEERRDVNRLGDTVRDPDSIQAPQYRQCGAFWWSHFRHLVWSLLWSASVSLGIRDVDPGTSGVVNFNCLGTVAPSSLVGRNRLPPTSVVVRADSPQCV